MNEQALLAVMSGANQSLGATALRGVLACLAPLYAIGASVKNAAFDLGLVKAHDLGRPTVSIGNLTTGGTGKTPMVAWVVKQLAQAGHRPCVLLRGYKSKNGISDEAEELRSLVGDVAQVAPCSDRVAEAKRQLAAHPEISCFVLDDGFQHRRAKRNLDLVLVDATNPWGYGWTLPRGLLREKMAGLKRADGVVMTRTDRVPPEQLAQVGAQIQAITGRAPLALARHGWEGFTVWKAGAEGAVSLEALKTERVAITCGIGNATAFITQAHAAVGEWVAEWARADHQEWALADLRNFETEAQDRHASALLTTEKDFVKWRPLLAQLRPELPIFRPRLCMQFPQGHEALATLLASKIPFTSPAAS